ncbi:response regulator transcription factor [Gracilimonas amylolytica]|uniref:response regulator transcription factor n=1 Tax=Gracilimonas amylolytica TaxID=1749045 RepID=UPI000CD9DF3B|nr:response regulator transcription factor [Gracilimonas amylolytica]
MRALVVEDEVLLNEELEELLLEEHFTVDTALDFDQAKDLLLGEQYDLVLLDLSLPGGDGLDLLKLIKKQRKTSDDTAVIILTARGELEDRVQGLELGSDDYLSKPFAMPELRARIHAVLRRKFKIDDNEISIEGVSIHLDQTEVSYKNGFLDLTDTEYKMLRYLFLNKNKTVTRIALSEHIWGNKIDDRFSLDFINSHMKNIRRKLSDAGAPDLIDTVYGVGYKVKAHEA